MAWNIIEKKPNWEYSDNPNLDKKTIDHYDYDNNTVHTNGSVQMFSGEKFVLARQRFHDHPGHGELYVKYAPISAIYDSGNVAWTYTLPDDIEIRNATRRKAGEANLFYDASGNPIAVTGVDILADPFINTWNVLFVEVDEVLETGRLIVYPGDITYSEAFSIMRKYDLPDALYINGVRHIFNNNTGIWYDLQDLTTLFQDVAGTLPVYMPGTGQVDPPVGLMLDNSQELELGPELIPQPLDFTDWGFGGTGTASGGTFEITTDSAGGPVLAAVFETGKTYQIHIAGTTTASDLRVRNGGSVTGSFSVNTPSFDATVITPNIWDGALNLYLLAGARVGGSTTTITDFSVREIKGCHAYQETTTARPTLSGRYNLLTAIETLSTQIVTTTATNYTLRFEGEGSINLSGAATGTYTAGTHTITCTGGTLTCTVAGTVTKADLRVKAYLDGSNLPAYQEVTDANTYDTDGFPLYLKRDRVDDDLIVQAPEINGVSAWGAAEGSLFGKVNIAAGEYHPLGVITEGLTTCTQLIHIDGALSVAETAVLERLVASKSGTTYDVTTADPVVFQFDLTSVSTFNFALQTKSGLPVLVDWGDGNTTAYAGTTDQTATKTYAASGNYTVKVYAKDYSVLTKFNTLASGMFGTLSLPSGMTSFRCEGSNTLSGTISLPSGMTFFRCAGLNTLSGTLSLPSGMTYFHCVGNNTLSGTLSLPSGMTYFLCTGSNTLSGYTSSAKASYQQRFYLIGQNTLSATDVDNILIDYDAAGGTWTGGKEITIQGNAANRTSASDAAYASLATKLTTLNVD